MRDERIYTYFDLAPGAKVSFDVRLRAAYIGRFFLPSSSVEAMYDPRIRSRIKGKWIEVINPGHPG